MPPRSSPSITSTTKRAKCLSGSHSSTDGGRRNAVRRSKSRKLLIAIKPPFGANQWRDSSENQRRWVKSDRLLEAKACFFFRKIEIRAIVRFVMSDIRKSSVYTGTER